MAEVQDVVDKLQSLNVKEDEVKEDSGNDFGSRLRLVEKALLIQEIGNQLHCSIITITKAQVFFHQFQRLKKNECDPLCVAASCLNLSIKLCEGAVKTDEIIIKFYHMAQDIETNPNHLRPDPSPEKLQEMRRNLCHMQDTISRVMAFKLKCAIAHTYVYNFLAQLQSLPDASEGALINLSSSVTKILSTYYLCDGCLDFNADEIAIACFQFSFLFCGIVSPSVSYFMEKELASVGNRDRINDILHELIIVAGH